VYNTEPQVRRIFEEVERQTHQPLPTEPFPFYHEGNRKVHRDGHVEVAKGYYSVPPEYLGREVWVRWDSRLFRVFKGQVEQIAVHPRVAPGKGGRSTDSTYDSGPMKPGNSVEDKTLTIVRNSHDQEDVIT
jgi:hypothetical protein